MYRLLNRSLGLNGCGSLLLGLNAAVGPFPLGKGIGGIHCGSRLNRRCGGLLLTGGAGGLELLIILLKLRLTGLAGWLLGGSFLFLAAAQGTHRLVLFLVVIVKGVSPAENRLFFLFGPTADRHVFLVLVILVILVIIIVVFQPTVPGGASFTAKENIQDEDKAEHSDGNIRHIKDGEVEKLHLEHILHITVEDAVNAVADTAGHDKDCAPAAERAGDEIGGQGNDHGNGENDADDDEIDSGVSSAQKAESGALIMDVHETEHTGNKLFDSCVEHNISGNPVLQPLVGDDDQHSNDGIQHIFLQSAAG